MLSNTKEISEQPDSKFQCCWLTAGDAPLAASTHGDTEKLRAQDGGIDPVKVPEQCNQQRIRLVLRALQDANSWFSAPDLKSHHEERCKGPTSATHARSPLRPVLASEPPDEDRDPVGPAVSPARNGALLGVAGLAAQFPVGCENLALLQHLPRGSKLGIQTVLRWPAPLLHLFRFQIREDLLQPLAINRADPFKNFHTDMQYFSDNSIAVVQLHPDQELLRRLVVIARFQMRDPQACVQTESLERLRCELVVQTATTNKKTTDESTTNPALNVGTL